MAISKINSNSLNTDEATLSFSTSGVERMVITSAGNVGIGTATPTQPLDVVGAIKATVTPSNSVEASFLLSNSAGTSNANLQLNTAGGLALWSYENGGAGWQNSVTINSNRTLSLYGIGISYPTVATTFSRGSNSIGFTWASPNFYATVDNVLEAVIGTASDYRLKDNVTDYQSSLSDVMNLRPVTYNPKELGCDDCDETKTEIGLIAHEVAEIFPSLVSGEKDATNEDGDAKYQSLNYSGFTPILIKAIQEQQQQIEELKAKVAALEIT